MQEKVILLSIDGMRPDGVLQCKNPYVDELMRIASYTYNARTVFPSITLPCYMSLFHSVPPEIHGTAGNTYIPPVHPINGLFEQLKKADKISAMYYGWEPMRDLSRPGSLMHTMYIDAFSAEHTDVILTDHALNYIKIAKPDFVFIYLIETDEKGGHDNGWMSSAYLDYISCAISCVRKVIEETNGEYSVIVTADHGGHDSEHGSEMDEDMIIPMFFYGQPFAPGKKLGEVSILDIAPTIADIMGVPKAKEWQGKSLFGDRNQ